MGAYKRNVIKMGAYIHGVLILCGCSLSRFYGKLVNSSTLTCPGLMVNITLSSASTPDICRLGRTEQQVG